nr:MAG TPA: hypothetical protein [Caudoviricetes sp.]
MSLMKLLLKKSKNQIQSQKKQVIRKLILLLQVKEIRKMI